MAKVTIVGDAIVITSSKTLEAIKTLEKYRPNALSLSETNENGKKEAIFKVGVAKGEGSISTFGASFSGETHDEEKLATITMTMPHGTENAKTYVAELLGTSILNLNKVEAQFDDAVAEVEAEKAAILENITIAQ